jgi:hypothetical protein
MNCTFVRYFDWSRAEKERPMNIASTCKTFSTIAGMAVLFAPAALAQKMPPPPVTGQFAPSPGVVNAPAAIGGQEDRSYLSTSASQLSTAIQALDFNPNAPPRPPQPSFCLPDHILSLDFGFRAFRHDAPVYVPSLTYSNTPYGIDLTAQFFSGSVSGFGLSSRFDLSPARLRLMDRAKPAEQQVMSRYRDIQPLLAHPPDSHDESATRAARQKLNDAKKEMLDLLEPAHLELVRATREWRVAGLLGDRSLSDIGNLFNIGLTSSHLLRFAGNAQRDSWGVTPLASVEGVAYTPTGQQSVLLPEVFQHSASFIRTRLALTAQDHTLYYDKASRRIKGFWHIQLGVEYDFRNVLDQADTLNVFLRWRDTSHFQAAVIGGFRSDHQDYVGLNISWSWDVGRHDQCHQ